MDALDKYRPLHHGWLVRQRDLQRHRNISIDKQGHNGNAVYPLISTHVSPDLDQLIVQLPAVCVRSGHRPLQHRHLAQQVVHHVPLPRLAKHLLQGSKLPWGGIGKQDRDKGSAEFWLHSPSGPVSATSITSQVLKPGRLTFKVLQPGRLPSQLLLRGRHLGRERLQALLQLAHLLLCYLLVARCKVNLHHHPAIKLHRRDVRTGDLPNSLQTSNEGTLTSTSHPVRGLGSTTEPKEGLSLPARS